MQSYLSNLEFRKLVVWIDTSSQALRIIGSGIAVSHILGRPTGQKFTADASEFGQPGDAIQRHATSLLPVLNRLIADAHLPSHVGDGVKLCDGVFECLVHGPYAIDEFETIVAQETLVTQVKVQLPQGMLAGIFAI
jgi:hypothetical protein